MSSRLFPKLKTVYLDDNVFVAMNHVVASLESTVERLAKNIYEQWCDTPGYVPWVNRGNSDVQEHARDIARKQLDEWRNKQKALT